jgi:hypothetical protein
MFYGQSGTRSAVLREEMEGDLFFLSKKWHPLLQFCWSRLYTTTRATFRLQPKKNSRLPAYCTHTLYCIVEHNIKWLIKSLLHSIGMRHQQTLMYKKMAFRKSLLIKLPSEPILFRSQRDILVFQYFGHPAALGLLGEIVFLMIYCMYLSYRSSCKPVS